MMTAVQGLCGLSNTQASNIVKNARVQNFTPQQIVAITILAEARGEGERGMYAVACVIAQRAIEGKTRPDLVCIAPAQFSCWNPSNAQYKKLNSLLTIPESVYALKLVDKLGKLKRSYVGYANHYHTHTVAPSWSRGKAPVKIIGGHRFFRLYRGVVQRRPIQYE